MTDQLDFQFEDHIPNIVTQVAAQSVGQFFAAFDPSRDPKLWADLVDEELREVEEAVANLLKELADVLYVTTGLAMVSGDVDTNDVDRQRLLSIAGYYGQAFSASQIAAALRRVHQSNMSKLGDDGKPLRREDGKILKGPNYQPPYLKDLV